jgi:adenylylsulfate reductase, subunit B
MLIKKIDEFRCDGCGACERTCMGDVIRMKDGKAFIAYPEDCSGCISCELSCPRYAINVA